MGIQRRILKSLILFLGDTATFYAALFLMLLIRYRAEGFIPAAKIHLIPFSIIFFLWLIVFYIAGLYELRIVKNSPPFYDRLYKASLLNAVIAILVFYLVPYFQIAPRTNLFIVLTIAFLLILVFRWSVQTVMAARGASRVLFFGFSPETIALADFLRQNPQLGYLPVAAMTSDEATPLTNGLPFKVFSFNHNLPHIIADEGIEIIVASSDIKQNKALVEMLFQVVPLGIPVIDFLSFYEAATGKIPVSLVGQVWFLENLVGVKKSYYEFFKRALDLLIAFLLGIPALALHPFIALFIKLDSAGPVFYRQKRVGKAGKEFWLIKYRSMIKNAEAVDWRKGEGPDPRHTRVGIILRKHYLDEIPQIINVLKGEMSFVGPRPERPEFVRELKSKIPFYEMRLMVKPGITGWAQVNMENDASVEDALEKLQYDLSYIKNRSIWLDMTIALKTILTMLSREGR